MNRLRIVGLMAALVIPVAGSAAAVEGGTAARAVGGNGAGDSYFPLDGNTGYDVAKYVIRDRLSFKSGELTGNTTITAVADVELTQFNLDLLLHVDKVKVNGVLATAEKPDPHELQITPAAALPDGQPFTVRVWYHGHPDEISYATEASWFASDDEVVAMNEPHIAPYWFPANDHPTDKARFDIKVSVPTGNQVVSNGVLVAKNRGQNWTGWRWVPRDPMAPYLAFFAAGKFELKRGKADGKPYVLAVSRQLPPLTRAKGMEFLARTPEVIRWLEKRLGDYPFEATGGVITALNTGFALETQTRPVYTSSAPSFPYLLAHELGHQWFGDLVSVERWNDIWINEGFAQYMEELWVGGVPAWLAEQYKNNGNSSPLWDLKISDPGPQISNLFADAIYRRGAMTLAALRRVIGKADFWALMRTWIDEHAHGNASVEEFRSLAETVSGEELNPFFKEWLDDEDRPDNTTENGLGF